jgi:hypothetical protein
MRKFFLTIGILMLAYKLIVGIHDLNVSSDARMCIYSQLGDGFLNHWKQNEKWKEKNRWNEAAVSYIKTVYENTNKQAVAIEKLRDHCSDSIELWQSLSNGNSEYIIVPKNWGRSSYDLFTPEINPARYEKRKGSVIFWGIWVLAISINYRRLNKIFIWSKN